MDAEKRKKYFVILNMMRIIGDNSLFTTDELTARIANTDVFDDLYERIDELDQATLDEWLKKAT